LSVFSSKRLLTPLVVVGLSAVLTFLWTARVYQSSSPKPTAARSALGAAWPGATDEAATPAVKGERPFAFPYLPDELQTVSRSIGDTSDGRLVAAVAVVESEALGILPIQRKRDLRYGTREIVDLITRAARQLHAATGTRLWLGNVGDKHGGDIRYSVSHNSGRDADIALCYQDAKGRPANPPDLVPVAGSGRAVAHALFFDVARTWIVVKALLDHPSTQVQYLFVSHSLREKLMRHARLKRETAKLLDRAMVVLRQPYGSAAHNDHLHLRIYCSQRDVISGCVNTGVEHGWTNTHRAAKRRFAEHAAQQLDNTVPTVRRQAVERLALLQAKRHAKTVTARLGDEVSTVREAAAVALAQLDAQTSIAALATRYDIEPRPEVRIAIAHTVSALGGDQAGRFLARAVGEPTSRRAALPPAISPLPLAALVASLPVFAPEDTPSEVQVVQLAAIEAAGRSERIEPVSRLVALLDDDRAMIRAAAAGALRKLTNLSYGVNWRHADKVGLDRGRGRWRAALARSARAPRAAWLTTGFRAAGYRVRELRPHDAWELARAIGGHDRLSYNAQRSLMRIFKHRPRSLSWPKHDACAYWHRWLKRRRRRLALPPVPKNLSCG
jgi:murein endopeptidase/HEAT repeat protein